VTSETLRAEHPELEKYLDSESEPVLVRVAREIEEIRGCVDRAAAILSHGRPEEAPRSAKDALLAFPLSRDLHTNVSRLRSRIALDALRWRARANDAAKLERGQVAKGEEPDAAPTAAVYEAIARTCYSYQKILDAILDREERET